MEIQNLEILFRQIMAEHQDELMKICMHYCGNSRFVADDIVQQALINLFNKLNDDGLDSVDDYKSYMIRTLRNLAYNHKRDNAKVVYVEDHELLEALDEGLESAENQYLEEVVELKSGKIMTKIKERNETWYYIVVEVFLMGRPQVEVANELGLTSGAMYATIRRMRSWSNKNINKDDLKR